MDSIVVKVSDLYQMAKELSEKKMDYVQLSLLEADNELPACASFNAISGSENEIVDFEEIEAVASDIAKEFDS